MEYIWDNEGIKIFATISVRCGAEGIPVLSGIGMRGPDSFAWTSQPTSHGWWTEIVGLSGRLGSIQGKTFNLPLEVAFAAAQLVK